MLAIVAFFMWAATIFTAIKYGWRETQKVNTPTGRLFLRTGILSFLFTPTIFWGHSALPGLLIFYVWLLGSVFHRNTGIRPDDLYLYVVIACIFWVAGFLFVYILRRLLTLLKQDGQFKKPPPPILNRICAHPVIVTWIIGAFVLNCAIILLLVSMGASLSSVISDISEPDMLLMFIPTTLLGYFLGMFTCWPLIRVICSKYNGAPLKVGDQVMILSGSRKGYMAEVYEITTGQGGWALARLELGHELKEKFEDMYEEYSLFKISNEDR